MFYVTFSFSRTKADFLSNKRTRADTQNLLLLVFFTVCFIEKSYTSTVSMEKSYHDGATLKKSLHVPQGNMPQGNVSQGNQCGAPQNVPGYGGDNPPEANLDPMSLSSHAQTKMQEDLGQMLIHTEKTRAHYQFDSENDPLLKQSHTIVQDPAASLQMHQETQEDTHFVIKKCTQPLDAEVVCETRYTPSIITDKEEATTSWAVEGIWWKYSSDPTAPIFAKQTHTFTDAEKTKLYPYMPQGIHSDAPPQDLLRMEHTGRSGGTSSWDSWGMHTLPYTYDYYNVTYLKTVKKPVPSWTHTDDLPNDYILLKEEIIEGPGAHTIDGTEVSCEHPWHVRRTYKIKGTGVDTCTPLLKMGCEHISTKCLETRQGRCVLQENTFRCGAPSLQRTRLTGKEIPFCLDGKCHEVKWEVNEDMLSSVSQLAILKKIQQDVASGSLFKGSHLQCTKHCAGFSDCCQLSGGWGQGLGFAHCSEEEKMLAKQRTLGHCVYVGTYCAEKILGVCIRKKSSYCCFGNKMGRIVQEQGRQQLGLGFGEAKCASCNGFSVEQLSSLRFDQMNLREIFDEVTVKNIDAHQTIAQTMAQTMDRFQKDWHARLPHATPPSHISDPLQNAAPPSQASDTLHTLDHSPASGPPQ